MDALVEEGQRFLFHYTTRDAALGSILPTRRFRFSSFEQMRDPYENKDWSLPGGGFYGDANPDDLDRRYFEILELTNMVKRQARLAAFSMSAETSPFSANRGWARPSMWEHYAESHAGVCLVFDQQLLVDEVVRSLASDGLPQPYYKPVDYQLDFRSDPMIEVNDHVVGLGREELQKEVFDFVERNHRALFYRKANDWSNEMEFRFVATVADDHVGPLEFNIENSLVGLIVGERFADWAVPGALELVEKLNETMNVSAKRLSWLGHEPVTSELKPRDGWTG